MKMSLERHARAKAAPEFAERDEVVEWLAYMAFVSNIVAL